MASMLGIGPRSINIGRTRIIFAIAGVLAAAVVLVAPDLLVAIRAVEVIGGALIASLLYEPLQKIDVPARRAPTVASVAVFAGTAIACAGLPTLNLFHAIAAQFVFTTILTTLLFGCMFVADRMRAIWRDNV